MHFIRNTKAYGISGGHQAKPAIESHGDSTTSRFSGHTNTRTVFSWEAAAKNKPAGAGGSQNYLEAQVWFTEKF